MELYIVYSPSSKPLDAPMYVVARIENHNGPPWNQNDHKLVPMVPVSLCSWRKTLLTIAWAIAIHKSQGLTIQKERVDIGNIERQGITFTTMSKVRSLSNLYIQPTFSFGWYSRIQNNLYATMRKKEESCLQQLSLYKESRYKTLSHVYLTLQG